MLKPLTLSLSLAVALGACSVSMAGGLLHGNSGCTTCGIASPQGIVSPQASAQCAQPCATPCAPKKKCFSMPHLNLGSLCKPKQKCYTYTWVLKKKRVWGGCGGNSCAPCATYPSGQASPQATVSPAAQTVYGAPASTVPTVAVAPEMIPAGDEAPPPPAPVTGPQSSLLFGNPSGN
jgi:hypothetical protein